MLHLFGNRGVKMKNIIIYGVLFVVLNILDAITTIHGLSIGAMELNPIGKFFIEGGNFWIFKVGIPLLIVLVAILYTMHFPKVQYSSEKILKTLCIIFTLIVLWNSLSIIITK